MFSRLLLHAERLEHFIHALNILHNAILAANSKADIQRIDQRELCNTRRNENENPDLAFYVPKEGTNLFVDAMCIPKNAKNVSGAEKFINFMCSTEAAMANWEYVGYSSPQTEVYNELDEEITSDPLYFPDITQYPTEAYTNLPTEINQFYNDFWVDILT